MKKITFAFSAVIALSTAIPVVAQEADTAADPFVSTQNTNELAVIGGVAFLVLLAAATNGGGSSSSSSTSDNPWGK